jgi:hypothetical protein
VNGQHHDEQADEAAWLMLMAINERARKDCKNLRAGIITALSLTAGAALLVTIVIWIARAAGAVT